MRHLLLVLLISLLAINACSGESNSGGSSKNRDDQSIGENIEHTQIIAQVRPTIQVKSAQRFRNDFFYDGTEVTVTDFRVSSNCIYNCPIEIDVYSEFGLAATVAVDFSLANTKVTFQKYSQLAIGESIFLKYEYSQWGTDKLVIKTKDGLYLYSSGSTLEDGRLNFDEAVDQFEFNIGKSTFTVDVSCGHYKRLELFAGPLQQIVEPYKLESISIEDDDYNVINLATYSLETTNQGICTDVGYGQISEVYIYKAAKN